MEKHMNRRTLLLTAIAIPAAARNAFAQQQESDPEMAKRMRELFFAITPEQGDLKPNSVAPTVMGVSVDWPMNQAMSTIVAYTDGTASLYTTTGIAIMGGYAAAAQAKTLVLQAERSLPFSRVVTEHPYPSQDSARFYIRTYTELRVIEEKLSVAMAQKSRHDALFAAANDIMTALFAAADETQDAKKN